MGADFGSFYDNICGGDSVDAEDVKKEEEELAKKKKEMKGYITMAKAADEKLSRQMSRADLKEWGEDYGKMLYLFYLKMFNIQHVDKGKSWIHDPGSSLEKDKKKEKDTKFDYTKADPFEDIHIQWKDLTDNEKRGYLEEIWDILLGNTDDANAPDNFKSKDEQEMFEARQRVLLNSVGDLTEFERKVYLLKFCITAGATINKMDDIKQIDLVEVYMDADTTLEDMMISNND
eukprot:789266_1